MKTVKNNSIPKKTEILIAEDSLTQATQIKHLLKSHHYKVTVAHDGKEAISQISKHKPSLVISDIMMPEINGYELCKKIKSDKNTEDIPVILLTVLADPGEIIEGLSCGADSFITKPYNETHLLNNIEKILSVENKVDTKKMPFEVQILFNGEKRFIQAEQQNIVKLMLDIYEGAIHQNERLVQTQEELRLLNERLESLVQDRTSDLIAEIELSNQITDSLRESEKKYHGIFDNVTDLYYETLIDGTIIDVSPSISIMSKGQYSRDDLIGEPMSKFYSDPAERQSLLAKLKKHGSITDFEITLKNRDGSPISCSVSSKISFDAQGKPDKIIGSMRDISDRKLAEDKIDIERKMLRTLINNIPDLIYVKDTECRKVIANIADVKNIGYDREEEVLGKTDLDLYPGQSGQRGYADDKGVINSGKPILEHEEDFVDYQGVRRWLVTSKIPLFDKDRKITGLVGISHDITQRKRANEELIEAKEKAEENDRLKTAFLHNISHEIRTPMNAIIGFSTLLGEPGIDAQTQQSYIETIIKSSDHLLAIISDIIDISNIEAKTVKIVKNEINLNSTLKSLVNQFLPNASDKKIQLVCETEVPDSDAFVITDSTKLNQILTNLINNAIKFTDKGYVKVGCELKGKFLEFCVSDTGMGIPEELFQKIFDRFYQVQNAISRLYEGTGLGLAISKEYVELLGGKIWLTSEPGAGTSFFFAIPYEKQVVETLTVVEAKTDKGFAAQVKKTILVAEDIDSNFKLIEYFLSGTSTKLIKATNGKEAVEIALNNRDLDLILMDIKMPVMDGYTATKLIREANITIPIIAQTAYADDMEKVLESGCSGFISKPFNRKGLLNTLAEFIG
ncbi:MAG: response regulator [Bacteroidales bacterium]